MNAILIEAVVATITTIVGTVGGFALGRLAKKQPKEAPSVPRPANISPERWAELQRQVDEAAARAFPELVGR